ncbi:MAG: InlB B-repeat-containing protein [Oceanipulchritudo sp.]
MKNPSHLSKSGLAMAVRALLMTLAGWTLSGGPARAELLLEESFIFSATNLQGEGSGSGWAGPWQTGVGGSDFVTVPGLLQANDGRLAVRGNAVTDSANAASTIYREMAAPLTEDLVYLSFLWYFSNNFSAYMGLGTEAHDNVFSTASFRVARLDSNQQLGWWDPAASRWQSSGLPLAAGQAYFIVVKAEKGGASWGGGDDTLSFWIDPAVGPAEGEPTWSSANVNFGNLDTSRLLAGTNWNGAVIDEVRLGTDWASVTPRAEDFSMLTVSVENGSVTRSPDQASYAFGTEVTLTAVATDGYIFAGWTGDVNGLENPVTVAVTADLHVTATFVPAALGLKITVEAENGTVLVDPLKEGYAEGEVVTLTAVADEGYRFDGWNKEVLDYRISAPVTMTGDLLVAPRFTPAPFGEGGVGANVREEFVKEVLYVDVGSGLDSHPGTQAQPFKTIGRALARAEQLLGGGTGVKVLIQPGVYREEVRVPAAQFTAPLVIEGAGWTEDSGNTGDVIISGAAPLEGLSRNADGIYELPWIHNWGFQPDPFDWAETPTPAGMRRFEWILLGNEAFLHVFSYEDLLAAEGHHVFVDEVADKLYLKGPAGIDLATAGVEMTRFASGAPNNSNFLMWIKGSGDNPRSHIVVRNLVFEKGCPGAFRAALHIHDVANVLVEDVVGRLNHSLGVLADAADYSTLRRISVHGNTIQGMGFGQTTQGRIEHAHIFDNCEVSFRQGYTGWAPCGMKNGELQNSSMLDLVLENNYNHGLWLDTGTRQVEVLRLRSLNNARNGLYFENNNRNNMSGLGDTKTAVFRHAVIAGNGDVSAIYAATGGATGGGSGLYTTESENLHIEESVIYNHDENIGIGYNNRGPLGNLVLTSTVVGEPAGQSQRLYRQFGNILAWQQFFDTIRSDFDFNLYYDADDAPFMDRALASLSLTGWREALAKNPLNPNRPVQPDFNSLHITDHTLADFRILSIRPLAVSIREGALDVPAFRITRVQADLSGPMQVAYRIDSAPGRAEAADFAGGLDGTVTIPAGSMHVDILLSPLEDGIAEGPETLLLGLEAVAGYDQFYFEAAVEIGDLEAPDLPRVDLVARVESAREGTDHTLVFDLTRSGSVDDTLAVQLMLEGDSEAGADWRLLSTEVVFSAQSAHAELAISLLDDAVAELPETLVVKILRPDVLTYAPGPKSTAIVTIEDDDLVAPKLVLRSEPAAGRTGSFPLSFPNPTSEAFAYTVQPTANSWDVQPMEPLDWVEPSGTPVSFTYVVVNDDGVSGAIPLGFTFPLFGRAFESVYIHTNGFLTFVPLEDPGSGYRVPLAFPAESTGVVNPYTVAPYWRNWGMDTTSRVYAHPGPDGGFVVTFKDLYQNPAFPTKRRATWQVLLRPSGQLEYRYLRDDSRGSYVVGLQGAGALEGFTLAEADLIAAGLRVVLTPMAAFLSDIPPQVDIPPSAAATVTINYDSRDIVPGVYSFELPFQPADLSLPLVRVPLEFRVGIPLSAPHFPESSTLGDFWTRVPGFGWVYDRHYPVVNHAWHGWLYLFGSAGPAFFYYDYALATWAYTSVGSSGFYPWIAFLEGGKWTWRYYIEPTVNPRWFWNPDGYTQAP